MAWTVQVIGTQYDGFLLDGRLHPVYKQEFRELEKAREAALEWVGTKKKAMLQDGLGTIIVATVTDHGRDAHETFHSMLENHDTYTESTAHVVLWRSKR